MRYALCAAVLIAALAGVIVVSTCLAASSLKAPRITHEMESLGGIESVRFLISPLPTTVIDVEVDDQWLRDRFEAMLRDHGLTLTSEADPGDIQLRLTIFYRADEAVEGGVGFVCFLAVEQPMLLERLGKKLLIPTWTGASIEIAPREDFRERLIRGLDDVFHDFVMKHDVVRTSGKQ